MSSFEFDCIFQLAQDIIFDLRQLLKQVRSTENQLRPQQGMLENTLQQALGIYWHGIFQINMTLLYFIFLLFRSVRSRTIASIELKNPSMISFVNLTVIKMHKWQIQKRGKYKERHITDLNHKKSGWTWIKVIFFFGQYFHLFNQEDKNYLHVQVA